MASQGAAFLMQADLVPPLGANLWDTSFLLSETSLAGRVLHTLIGYTAQPAGIQVVFYIATMLVIGGLMRPWRTGERAASATTAGEYPTRQRAMNGGDRRGREAARLTMSRQHPTH